MVSRTSTNSIQLVSSSREDIYLAFDHRPQLDFRAYHERIETVEKGRGY